MQEALISIIVPVYKTEKYLRRCVDSILAQTYTNIEVILVCDESPDNCGVICDEFKQKDSRVIVIHKENEGVSSARNDGLDVATGEYYGTVDSDDYIHPDMYKKLYRILKNKDADIAACRYQRTSEWSVGEAVCDTDKEDLLEYTNMEAVYDYLEVKDNVIDGHTWNKLYKRDLFKCIRFPIGSIADDVATVYKLLYEAKKVVSTSQALYYFYNNPNSSTRVVYSERMFDSLVAIKEQIDFFVEKNEAELIKLSVVRYYLHLYKHYLKVSEFIPYKKAYIKELFRDYKKTYCKRDVTFRDITTSPTGLGFDLQYVAFWFHPELSLIIWRIRMTKRKMMSMFKKKEG